VVITLNTKILKIASITLHIEVILLTQFSSYAFFKDSEDFSEESSDDSTSEYISQRHHHHHQQQQQRRVEYVTRQQAPKKKKRQQQQPKFALLDLTSPAALYLLNANATSQPNASTHVVPAVTHGGAEARRVVETSDKSTATINDCATQTDTGVFRSGFEEDFLGT
jgi:hypothetical protein